jgi:hypothetical protein
MRQLYRMFVIALGVGLAFLGVRVLLSDPPFVSFPSLVRIIGFLLCLGTGVGFTWEAFSASQRQRVAVSRTSGWARGFSLLPLVCYGVLLAYACYAWFHVGHWPYYAHPDPKQLPHGGLLTITGYVFTVGLFSMVLVPAGFLVRRVVGAFRRKALPWPHRAKMLYLAGAAVWALDIAAELSHLPWSSNIGWLAD